MADINILDLMNQRLALRPADGVYTPEEEAELLEQQRQRSLPRSAAERVRADDFALDERRMIAPLLTRAGNVGTVSQIKRLSGKHMAMMDYMLANPKASSVEIAKAFDVTLPWFSTVRNSDLFRTTYNERRALISERQKEILSEQFTAIAHSGLNALQDAIHDEDVGVSTKLAITKFATEALGYGVKGTQQPSSVNVNVTNNTLTVEGPEQTAIQNARARILERAQRQNAQSQADNGYKGVTIDG